MEFNMVSVGYFHMNTSTLFLFWCAFAEISKVFPIPKWFHHRLGSRVWGVLRRGCASCQLVFCQLEF